MRAGGGTPGWAAYALAALVTSAAAQSPADPARLAASSDAIAANDALAATAGGAASGNPTAAPPSPAASVEPTPQTPAAPASGFERFASWMGVDSENVRWLRLGTWDGSLDLTYSRNRLEAGATSVSGEARTTTRIAGESMTIRNEGFSIFDRRLISGSLGVTLGLDQVKQEYPGGSLSQHGDVYGYAFDATFLGEKPLYAQVWADRVQGYSNLSFGETTKNTESTAGVSLNLRQDSWLRDEDILPFFDAQLQAYRQHTLQQYTTEGTTTAQDQVQDVVNLTAHNGTETSDLYVLARYVNFNYVSYPTGSYIGRGASVAYSGDFGKNLDTAWYSLIGVDDRSGDIPLKTFTVDESLDVRHNTALESSYTYDLYQQNGSGGNARNQDASASLTYRLWQNLVLTATGSGSYNRIPNGTVEGVTGSVSADYHRDLPIGGTGFVTAQGNIEHTNDKLSSGEIAIIDEAHSAPPVLGVGNGFALNNPFVLANSIVIVDTRGGARTPTTVNVDYTVITDGNKTRILVLPTSLVIQPNDPLTVSYSYQLPPEATYTSSNWSVSVGADLGWLAASYSHMQVNAPTIISGTVTLVGGSTSDTVTAALRGQWESLNANLGASAAHYDSASLAYVSQTYSAGLAYQPFYAVGINANGAWSRTNYTVPERKSGNLNGRIDINLYAPPSTYYDVFWTTLYVMHSKLTDSEAPTQTLTQFGATLNYNVGKLTFAAGTQYAVFKLSNSTTKNFQFTLSANRRF